MDVLFLMSIFRLNPGLKMSFEHISVRKNLFLSACFCQKSRLFYIRCTKNLNLVEPLVMRTRTWSFNFVISKCLEYTQYYMMLLEQWGHIVAKVDATITRLCPTKFMFAWPHDWTTFLPLSKTPSALDFQLCQLLKQYVLHFTRYLAGRQKRY